MYKLSVVLSALLSLAAAGPIETRQTGTSSSEFSRSLVCRDILFAWARGSTEIGNMGTVIGPPLSDGLKNIFGRTNVATEGIDYAALVSTNVLPGGTDLISELRMRNTLEDMARRCPNSVIVTGGYSQGAAVNHRAIEDLSQSVKDQIAGTVLYGDTQRQQDNGQIPNFPRDKVLIICNTGDAVCNGLLTVLPPHLTYGSRAAEGYNFLANKIRGAQAKIKARNARRALEEAEAEVAALEE
ncbi:carbohydrate esterase family 5 protein [Sporormia fimetaria CBS 119925]|uniref:Cutinase n=1 Tax=Sporormia fimetaria CBS 119925 TaxID=1340428 RepID=A0A6A6V9G7_9PLEO|nr:carbohydrate esterase family 5 protein [Sporormia fimetaria CBS 119925]